MDASLIVPTYNRLESLRGTLSSLACQTFPADRFEVIVVDDGSTDGTGQAIEEEEFPFPLRYVRQANQGSAAARNAGANVAEAKVLIFVDDDMLLEPDYVQGLVEDQERYRRIVGMGVLQPHVPAEATVFCRIYAPLIASDGMDPAGAFVEFTECVTNNLAVKRDDFYEIGMMQDVAGDGPTWWGDVDFGYRAERRGFRFRKSGKAVCRHRDYGIQDLAAASARVQNGARAAVALFQKFPEVPAHLAMFEDKLPIDWRRDPAGLVARKLARPITSSNPVLWGLEGIVNALEKAYPSPRLLRPLYRWIIGGYVYRGYAEGLRQYGPVPRFGAEADR